MARPPANRPTDAEIAILRVLWERGPSTVRDVYEALAHDRAVGYTTILKLMQIMAAKRLVMRDRKRRTHVYRARLPREQTQKNLVADLLDRVFGGSAAALVVQALAAKRADAQELAQIRALIEEYARNEHSKSQSDPSHGGKI
ncbi:MAG TPA: BlaI/MecI/CopY family transcriptional regulator [Humisphaera sp.]|jgi:predicted transcriptional regulator|nr:BlaI/MecI/CopY family transcriptional regulator [Humisphaera sp.]